MKPLLIRDHDHEVSLCQIFLLAQTSQKFPVLRIDRRRYILVK
jgi:hypothetical protein